MNVWLIKTGEPLPLAARKQDRLHRTGLLAEALAARGHRVTWWTSTFDHYSRTHFHGEDADFRWGDRVTIRMLHGCGYRRNVSLRRMREHRLIAAKFASRARGEERPDVILCAYPTIEFGFEAVRYGREAGVPVVLDIRDLHPDIFVELFPRWGRPLAALLLRPAWKKSEQACAGATAISGVTRALLEWGLKRGEREGTEWDRWFPFGYRAKAPEAVSLEEAARFWDGLGVRDDGAFRACFIGTMGRTLDLEPVIGAAARLEGEGQPRVHFVLCGDGEHLARYREMARNLRSVLFPGRIHAAQIFVLLRRSSVGLDPLPDRFDFLASINNKAIEYLSAGLPVVSCPTRGVLHELLVGEGCGTSWEAGSGAGLARLLVGLSRDPDAVRRMAARSRGIFDERYAAEVVYGDMAAHLERLAESFARAGKEGAPFVHGAPC